MVIIEGTVEEIIFSNESNGYTVCDINVEEELVTAVGCMPYINEGEAVKLKGNWINHKDYGQQFKVELYEKTLPVSEMDILKYLSSGAIKGIRKATAEKIIDKFGEEALKVIENEPERLAEIKGISLKKAEEIGQAFINQGKMKNIILFFQQFGLGTNSIMKIYKVLGEEAVETVKENPYILVKEIDKIGFKVADKIASNLGFLYNNKERIKAGILYILSLFSMEGHTYYPKEKLIEKATELMEVDKKEVCDALISLRIDAEIIIEEECENIYLKSLYISENHLANKLIYLNKVNPKNKYTDISIRIRKAEKKMSIELETQQVAAIEETFKNNVTIITGGPGTGKTTIINIIIDIMEDLGLTVELAAPTGRAAKKMSEMTGKEAKTIHRLLEIGYIDELEELKFKKDEFDPLETDAVIVDEISMVDVLLMNHLLKAISPQTRIILIGDKDQLPSVGPGNVLKDIIESQIVKVVRLTEIFRQARESMIIVNAHSINKGEYPQLNIKDFYIVERNTSDQVLSTLVELCIKRLPERYGYDPRKDLQILSPMKKTKVGVNNLNSILQHTLNEKTKEKNERTYRQLLFREGDKVMQIRNNYTIEWENIRTNEIGVGAFNGDIGYIDCIDNQNDTITVIYDDERKIIYEYKQLDQLDLSYALTIHKSQGSEFKVVIIPVLYGPPVLLTRNLLYTAITRASEIVILIGNINVLYSMVDNNKEIERYSGLCNRLLENEKMESYIDG